MSTTTPKPMFWRLIPLQSNISTTFIYIICALLLLLCITYYYILLTFWISIQITFSIELVNKKQKHAIAIFNRNRSSKQGYTGGSQLHKHNEVILISFLFFLHLPDWAWQPCRTKQIRSDRTRRNNIFTAPNKTHQIWHWRGREQRKSRTHAQI